MLRNEWLILWASLLITSLSPIGLHFPSFRNWLVVSERNSLVEGTSRTQGLMCRDSFGQLSRLKKGNTAGKLSPLVTGALGYPCLQVRRQQPMKKMLTGLPPHR